MRYKKQDTKHKEKQHDKPASKRFAKKDGESEFAKPIRKSKDSKFAKPARKTGESTYSKSTRKSSESTNSRSEQKTGAPRKVIKRVQHVEESDGLIRLNKYIANSGVCSRREADELIATGAVSVNGVIVTELGTKVSATDNIQFGGETLKKERHVYLLLNKPKDYITTTDDPEGRKTVMALIQNACKERIYPVGRLDRSTTGLLLFTNDGELAKKLMHPRHGVKKIYHVELDNNLSKADMEKIASGVELEDGTAEVDEIAYDGNGKDKKCIGIQIHSGKNRIVRRIFESLGYKVVKLDRVYFAGLTKKDLPRGRWRFLTKLEISMLKMIS